MSQLYITVTNWLYFGVCLFILEIFPFENSIHTFPCFSPKQCNITFYHDINKYLLAHTHRYLWSGQTKHNNIFKIYLLFMMEKSCENYFIVLVPKRKTHTESKKSSNILSSITSWWLVASWFINDLIIALQLVCATVCWCHLVISAECNTKHNQLSHARLLSRCNLVMHRFSFIPQESGTECKLPGWSASAGCMKSWWGRRNNELLEWKCFMSVWIQRVHCQGKSVPDVHTLTLNESVWPRLETLLNFRIQIWFSCFEHCSWKQAGSRETCYFQTAVTVIGRTEWKQTEHGCGNTA